MVFQKRSPSKIFPYSVAYISFVIAFPTTQKGTDLLTDAPSGVSTRQLDELHISLK